ncbi:aldo/keto reductase [bacterium]|nr:aldo/keto reductase [bacterium]
MEKRKIGDIEVSPIGMGCMGLSHGYGEIPTESYSIEAIQKAFDFGCTFFDTAEAYAPNLSLESRGHNEKILGKALKDVRKNVVIATKLHISTDEVEKQGLYNTVKNHLELSLERLQTEYADLYYLHRINLAIPVEEVADVMGQLIKDKLIKGWGLSQVPVDIIEKAHKITPLSAVQNIYSMIERSIEEEVIPYCLKNNIGIVPFSPIASGFLSGKVTTKTDFSHSDDVRKYVPQLKEENIIANQPILDLIGEYAEKKQATKAQISLAWMLHKYPNVVPIPGSKNKERIIENLGAWNVALTDEEFNNLEKALNEIPVHGFRGHIEVEGSSMKDWNRKK